MYQPLNIDKGAGCAKCCFAQTRVNFVLDQSVRLFTFSFSPKFVYTKNIYRNIVPAFHFYLKILVYTFIESRFARCILS